MLRWSTVVIILKIVIPPKPQYFKLCNALRFVTGGLASLFSGTLFRSPSCNRDTMGLVEHWCSTIVVVFASAGEVVHSNKILMQQSMYLDGIIAKGSTFKRSQGEPSLSKEPQFVLDKDHNIWEFTERQFVSFGHHSSLWPKTATFESSQRGNSCPSAITVHCDQRPQHLRVHREAICVIQAPQFIVAKDSNIWMFTERLFVSFGHHCSLWPKTATFESSQRGYLCHSATTVHCGQRLQHLRVHREEIRALRLPQLFVAKNSNIWEFTERLFVSFSHHCSFWPKTATFESSQRGYSYHSATTVHFGQRQLHLKVHREAICVIRPPQFIVAKDSNIWMFTERLFVSFGHHCSLWPKRATFESSQSGYLYHSAATVHFGQRQQHLKVHREAICIIRPPLFILAKDSNIWKFTERLFVSFGHHCSLWPKTATLESSQRGYLCHSAITVHCSQRQKHLKVHREAICVIRPPQFIVAEDSNIWEFTEKLFVSLGHHSSLWPKTATFESSQRGYSWTKATIVCGGHMP